MQGPHVPALRGYYPRGFERGACWLVSVLALVFISGTIG